MGNGRWEYQRRKEEEGRRISAEYKRSIKSNIQNYGCKIPSPVEKTAFTCGRKTGRSSLRQQDILAELGVPREKSITWTAHRADKEIANRQKKIKDPIQHLTTLIHDQNHQLGKPKRRSDQ